MDIETRRAQILQANGARTLSAVVEVLSQNHVYYWVDGGTLLGIVRDQQFIENDTDIDIGVLCDDPDHVLSLLQQNGFHLWYFYEDAQQSKRLIRVEKYYVGVDIEFFTKTNDALCYCTPRGLPPSVERHAENQCGMIAWSFPANIVDELIQISFEAILVNIPKDYDQYLQIYYGNWRNKVPKSEYLSGGTYLSAEHHVGNPSYMEGEFLYMNKGVSSITEETIPKSIAVGILVYNPEDDELHLERIQNCLNSLCRSVRHCFTDVRLLIGMNVSENIVTGTKGMGIKTKRFLEKLSQEESFVDLITLDYKDSMNVKGYNILLKKLYTDYQADYASVFADDYIVPQNWFNTILFEFQDHPNADFIMPSTTYVTHRNLLVPVKEKESWRKNINEKTGAINGVSSGVTIADVEELAEDFRYFRTIQYTPSPSFETTVFTRDHLSRYGFLCDKYYSIWYNMEYFAQIVNKGARGFISRRGFVFHYGKGGTSAVHRKTGDEKYLGSPSEKYLCADVDLYNHRNQANIDYWWRNEPKVLKPTLSYGQIYKLIQQFDYNDIVAEVREEDRSISGHRWYRFGLLSRKQKFWTIGKVICKRIKLGLDKIR